MKLFMRHAIGFATMFIIAFVAICGIFAFIPLMVAFIAWDISFATFDWESIFAFIRINALVSFLMGLSYTFSKEGKQYAKGE